MKPAGPNGVFIVDKPSGPTSHDIVSGCRKLFGTRHVGHAGTLDPMASGVLVVLVGEACKLSGYLTASDKCYAATVRFGVRTTSFDADGEVVEEVAIEGVSREALLAALELERERTQQVPPEVSAIKLDGERSYRRARRGESVELAPRPTRVLELTLRGLSGTCADVELTVSKGYYVRALARDLGAALHLPAHLSALRRVRSGPFTLDEAGPWPPDEPRLGGSARAELRGWQTLAEATRRAFRCVVVTEEGLNRVRKGQRLGAMHFKERPPPEPPLQSTTAEVRPGSSHAGAEATGTGDVEAWFSPTGDLVALGRPKEPDAWGVVRGFNPRSTEYL